MRNRCRAPDAGVRQRFFCLGVFEGFTLWTASAG